MVICVFYEGHKGFTDHTADGLPREVVNSKNEEAQIGIEIEQKGEQKQWNASKMRRTKTPALCAEKLYPKVGKYVRNARTKTNESNYR